MAYASETFRERSCGFALKSKKVGGRACKPDSVPRANRKQPARAAIIPLVPVSLPGSSSLPEGSIEPGRLSPPIWPCTTRGFPCPRCCHRGGGLLPHLFTLAKRREHFVGVSQVSLCDATALHSAGGLFSVALSVAQPHCVPTKSRRHAPKRVTLPYGRPCVASPLALPGALPLALNRHFAGEGFSLMTQDGVRTFLPPSPLARTRPAIIQLTRHTHYTVTQVELNGGCGVGR